MRVDPDVLKCVMFLAEEREQNGGAFKIVPVATAFVVRLKENDLTWKYLVTARHVIEGAKDELYVRANLKTGSHKEFPIKKADWYRHDDADVACTEFYMPDRDPMELDYVSTPTEQFISDKYEFTFDPLPQGAAEPVGLGDDLVFIGLFVEHAGKERNLPIVRLGNIAAMPTEAVSVARNGGTSSFSQLAYLAECKSWGGVSGSPVFWTQQYGRQSVYLTGLLGLISSHYDIKTNAETAGDIVGTITTPINSGIAVVTPAHFVNELLLRDDLVEIRKKRAALSQQGNAATPS